MYYINAKTDHGTETIDEFESYKEAREMLAEYRMAYNMPVWISSRSTKAWREPKQVLTREVKSRGFITDEECDILDWDDRFYNPRKEIGAV
jgi:hypothetical protein